MSNFENRVIPVLTIAGDKLVKTIKFKKPNYIGDPVNAVKIFNEKMVDEIILLDITASQERGVPNYAKIEEICSEAFMPFAYGGGIKNIQQVDKLFSLGIEKVVLNSILNVNLDLVKEISEKYGAQSVVASIDVKKNIFGTNTVYTNSGEKKVKATLEEYVNKILAAGVGELFVNSIGRDGTFLDYDYELIKQLSALSKVPLIACGGARNVESFRNVIDSGASAAAAGSLFIYRGVQKGILINYPSQSKLHESVFTKL